MRKLSLPSCALCFERSGWSTRNLPLEDLSMSCNTWRALHASRGHLESSAPRRGRKQNDISLERLRSSQQTARDGIDSRRVLAPLPAACTTARLPSHSLFRLAKTKASRRIESVGKVPPHLRFPRWGYRRSCPHLENSGDSAG